MKGNCNYCTSEMIDYLQSRLYGIIVYRQIYRCHLLLLLYEERQNESNLKDETT